MSLTTPISPEATRPLFGVSRAKVFANALERVEERDPGLGSRQTDTVKLLVSVGLMDPRG